jgi:hypothetical protein
MTQISRRETLRMAAALAVVGITTPAVRAPDPFLSFSPRWILRRLSPNCRKIELRSLPKDRDEPRLLAAMGAETANIHAGDRAAARRALGHLRRQRSSWLLDAAEQMADAVTEDWRRFGDR